MKGRLTLLLILGATGLARAWDYEGHRMVNQLALASLPREFPSFVRLPAAAERIAFLSGEPDRWRNSPSDTSKHVTHPDHFLDLDNLPLYGLSPGTVSEFRYEFVDQLKRGRERYSVRFTPIDPARNSDRTRDLEGFLPWTINEQFAKLQSAFSYLKAYEQFGGTPEEIANAQQNVLYVMGVMGHYVGDAAQPLHTTKHFNGWVGPNPHGYTTNRTIHQWIDGGFIRRAGIQLSELRPRVRPAKAVWPGAWRTNSVFPEAMQFTVEQSRLVERLYQLDRAGQFSPGRGEVHEGREFISAQLVKGAQFLGDLWLSAWCSAPVDTYLRGELSRRSNENRRR